ncbi:PH domain-containing protein [Streptomyces sp. NPDC003077]|uniref:PH domain-containing protein n=1 Tax=Streptomyces sp. NPDC003077 TaxID=3154443 RepID=UPI0033B6D30A
MSGRTAREADDRDEVVAGGGTGAVGAAGPAPAAHTADEAVPDQADGTADEAVPEPIGDPEAALVPWLRLDLRMVWTELALFLLSLLPSYLTLFLLDLQPGEPSVWASFAATVVGSMRPLRNLLRWVKTRYRITGQRVELRVGVFYRKYRYVSRDRIRSVDITARFSHRLVGLRVLHIGSGERKASLVLDAVSLPTAKRLRRELLGRHAAHPVEPQPEAVPSATSDRDGTATANRDGTATANQDGTATANQAGTATTDQDETELARLSWWWLPYNLVNLWAFFVGGFLILAVTWSLFVIGIDLPKAVEPIIGKQDLSSGWTIALLVGVVLVVGIAGLAGAFITENYAFRLVRRTTETGTALVTRRGLFQTREVYRDDARLRGIHLSEPLFWRWIGLSETEVISTGLGGWSLKDEPASSILPRGPVKEARRVARLVLNDDVRPLEAPLRRHPKAALFRRMWWALLVPGGFAGVLAWLGRTGAVASWAWLVPVALLPVAAVLANVAYRCLGHTVTGPYVVLRNGLLSRSTTVLQKKAVIGWTVRQSFVQRWLGLVTIRVSTAAGYGTYEAPDVGTKKAIPFIRQVSPELMSPYVEEEAERPSPHSP